MKIPDLRSWKGKLKCCLTASPRGKLKEKPMNPSQHSDHASSSHLNEKVENKREWIKEHCISMDEKLGKVTPCDYSIFKVPKNLREVEQKAYIPQVVSIGPYHRGTEGLQEMEDNKWRLLLHVLKRTEHQLELYLKVMSDLEEKMRACYAQKFEKIRSQDFVEMMVLDACFVVELLNGTVNGFINCGYSRGDRIFTSLGALPCIKRDMLMLENQIPLFVLDMFYGLITFNPGEIDSVSQLALQFFDSVIPVCQNLDHKVTNSNDQGLHLLHVVQQCLLPSKATSPPNSPHKDGKEHQPQLMGHSVLTLRGSGVRFHKNPSKNFMDIEFKNGSLYIPPLEIHDSTMSIFLNLMAFEQNYQHSSNHVTSYIRFMDGLINCAEDVAYLRHKKIIDHKLGSEQEVARQVNMFCKEIVFNVDDKCYYHDLYVNVNRYVDKKWHGWRAILTNDYFTNPWATLSILAGIILLALTLLQTIYTVVGYYYK